MDQPNPSSSRTDRKTIERNRRNQMKALYSQLNSLVPHQSTKEVISLPDQLDEAATYIKKLQVSLERMKEKKNSLMGFENSANHSGSGALRETGSSSSAAAAARSGFITDTAKTSPRVEIHGMGSALEVVLTTGPDCQFMFNETIRILYEEGADIVNASFSLVNEDTVFHTIHCKIGEFAPGPRAARLSERLKKFVEDNIGS